MLIGHLIFFLNSWNLLGQSYEKKSFSLEEAQAYAMTHSYVAKNSSLDLTMARKKVWETISTGLPQIDLNADYNANLDLPIILIPGEVIGQKPGELIPVKFGTDFNSSWGMKVSQLIFDGSYFVGLKAAKVYVELALNTKEKTEIDIREAVAQAYYLVLAAEKTRKVMVDNLQNTQALLTETEAYFKNGFREEQDVDQIRLMEKKAHNEVIKADREIRVSRMVLKFAMGLDVNDTISLTTALDNLVAPLRQHATISYPFSLQTHINYRLQETQIELKERQLELEKSGYLPKINAFYDYQKAVYGDEANLFSEEWFPSSIIGVNVTLPLFNSGMKAARVRQARLEMEKAQNIQKQNIQDLQKNYLTALSDVRSAREKYGNDRENKEIAYRIYEKTRIKFNNGLASSTDLSQNEAQYIIAHQNYIQATLQLLQASLNLRRALGTL